MTQRTIDLGYDEFLEKANAYLAACEDKTETKEEFQRLVLNALVLAGLSGSAEFSGDDPASLTEHLSERLGLGTLLRYAAGTSASHPLGRPQLIRSAIEWFEERHKKEAAEKAAIEEERRQLFARIAEAEKNAAPANWVTVGDPKDENASSVAFRYPCPRIVYLGGLRMPSGFCCDDPDGCAHGHLSLSCADGTGFVPAKIESKPFLRAICLIGRERGWLTEEEEDVIFSLPEVAGLSEDLTEREREIMDDENALNKAVSFAYIGF